MWILFIGDRTVVQVGCITDVSETLIISETSTTQPASNNAITQKMDLR